MPSADRKVPRADRRLFLRQRHSAATTTAQTCASLSFISIAPPTVALAQREHGAFEALHGYLGDASHGECTRARPSPAGSTSGRSPSAAPRRHTSSEYLPPSSMTSPVSPRATTASSASCSALSTFSLSLMNAVMSAVANGSSIRRPGAARRATRRTARPSRRSSSSSRGLGKSPTKRDVSYMMTVSSSGSGARDDGRADVDDEPQLNALQRRDGGGAGARLDDLFGEARRARPARGDGESARRKGGRRTGRGGARSVHRIREEPRRWRRAGRAASRRRARPSAAPSGRACSPRSRPRGRLRRGRVVGRERERAAPAEQRVGRPAAAIAARARARSPRLERALDALGADRHRAHLLEAQLRHAARELVARVAPAADELDERHRHGGLGHAREPRDKLVHAQVRVLRARLHAASLGGGRRARAGTGSGRASTHRHGTWAPRGEARRGGSSGRGPRARALARARAPRAHARDAKHASTAHPRRARVRRARARRAASRAESTSLPTSFRAAAGSRTRVGRLAQPRPLWRDSVARRQRRARGSGAALRRDLDERREAVAGEHLAPDVEEPQHAVEAPPAARASSTSGSGGRALTMALTASFSAASSWCSSRYASMTCAASFSAACISRDAISHGWRFALIADRPALPRTAPGRCQDPVPHTTTLAFRASVAQIWPRWRATQDAYVADGPLAREAAAVIPYYPFKGIESYDIGYCRLPSCSTACAMRRWPRGPREGRHGDRRVDARGFLFVPVAPQGGDPVLHGAEGGQDAQHRHERELRRRSTAKDGLALQRDAVKSATRSCSSTTSSRRAARPRGGQARGAPGGEVARPLSPARRALRPLQSLASESVQRARPP